MKTTTLLVPGCRVRIVGGTYKGTLGVFQKETKCRLCILVDGCPDEKYLDKKNVKILESPKIKPESQHSDDECSRSECENNKDKLQQQCELLQWDIIEAKHLISAGLALLSKSEIELDLIIKQLQYL